MNNIKKYHKDINETFTYLKKIYDLDNEIDIRPIGFYYLKEDNYYIINGLIINDINMLIIESKVEKKDIK
mgnify:CR=1 FL=1